MLALMSYSKPKFVLCVKIVFLHYVYFNLLVQKIVSLEAFDVVLTNEKKKQL